MSVTEIVAYVPQPSPDIDVYSVCSRIEAWAATATDVFTLKDNKSKLSAIDQYLAQTSKEGRAQIAATVRRLEVRIGEVLGPAERGGDRKTVQPNRDQVELGDKERNEFRAMAAHPDVVEEVIAASTDEAPASRRKVIAAIKEKENPVPAIIPLDNSRDSVALRVATAREMAATGHTSRQIAARLGLSFDSMDAFRKRHGVEVPADAIVGRTRQIDPNRIVRVTVDGLRTIDTGLDLVDWADLDGDLIPDWISVLKEARKSITTLINNLEKEKTSREQQ